MKNNSNDKERSKPQLVAGIALALILIMAVAIVVGLSMPKNEEVIQGEVETIDYRLSSKVPSRVLEIRVSEGDMVRRGDTLVILEAPDIDARLEQANAALSVAEAIEAKAQNGARSEEIQAAFEQWQKAKAGLDIARKTYARVDTLFRRGVMAEQKRDEARANYEASVATEKAAAAQYDMAVNGARREDKAAATAQARRAQGAVQEVRSYERETVLRATADGRVSEIFPEVGELVGTGAPIMNVDVVSDPWFTFNVREDLLPSLSVGKEVSIYLPSQDRTVKARITRIKNVGNFATWKATKESDGFDLKVFELRAKPVEAIGGLWPGMSAILKKE